MRWIDAGAPAKQDSATSVVSVPLTATRETIIARTHAAMLPMTRTFDGYELTDLVVREFVEKLLDRKL
jgi:hypothetical protein